MIFNGEKKYKKHLKNLITALVLLVVISIVLQFFSKNFYGFLFILIISFFYILYFLFEKYTLNVDLSERITISYVNFLKNHKLEINVNGNTCFKLGKKMVYRRIEPNYFIKIINNNKTEYIISSEDNFDNNSILKIWEYLSIKYPNLCIKSFKEYRKYS
jgi:hypothetical protein